MSDSETVRSRSSENELVKSSGDNGRDWLGFVSKEISSSSTMKFSWECVDGS